MKTILYVAQDDLFHRQLYNGLKALLPYPVVLCDASKLNDKHFDLVIIHAKELHPQRLKKIQNLYSNAKIFLLTDSKFQQDYFCLPYSSSFAAIKEVVASLLDEKQNLYEFNLIDDTILQDLREGHSNKEIARRYGLPLSTTKYYVQRLYRKLNINSRGEASLIDHVD